MKRISAKQAERQENHYRDERGRYGKMNPCQGCGKGVGAEYLSHHLTDESGDDGESWNDEAICLCKKCAKETAELKNVSDFCKYAKLNGGIK